jgi:hypothetical protein
MGAKKKKPASALWLREATSFGGFQGDSRARRCQDAQRSECCPVEVGCLFGHLRLLRYGLAALKSQRRAVRHVY